MITTPWDQLSAAAIRHAFEHSDVENLLLPLDLHDDDDEDEHEHHHHDHDGDDDEDEHEHHHHDHDGDEHEHEHEHEHHHDGHGHHHHHHHHHHPGEHDADEVFTSWGQESARKFSEEELEGILKALQDETGEYGQIILRAKGIVPMTDGSWKQFDLVPEESEIRSCEADYTGRLCVIGCELNEKKLAELFGLA